MSFRLEVLMKISEQLKRIGLEMRSRVSDEAKTQSRKHWVRSLLVLKLLILTPSHFSCDALITPNTNICFKIYLHVFRPHFNLLQEHKLFVAVV